ncbi:hypothetical protein RHMOL_Rhmol13G0156300 [Rhododendron molle]|uniref:Uncharacterized protein n=1 Tax=Rhododendron molle TaxID=49168 RepID=A0ACC0L7K4_RHOML|nr:hypothetical protein RHMOL_Rhmol13G0156300 [Rhododendron molle]
MAMDSSQQGATGIPFCQDQPPLELPEDSTENLPESSPTRMEDVGREEDVKENEDLSKRYLPCVQMEFESEQEAYDFYNEYARISGFCVRRHWRWVLHLACWKLRTRSAPALNILRGLFRNTLSSSSIRFRCHIQSLNHREQRRVNLVNIGSGAVFVSGCGIFELRRLGLKAAYSVPAPGGSLVVALGWDPIYTRASRASITTQLLDFAMDLSSPHLEMFNPVYQPPCRKFQEMDLILQQQKGKGYSLLKEALLHRPPQPATLGPASNIRPSLVRTGQIWFGYHWHEIVGVVTQVGCKVHKFKVGDKAAVGCFVGSCRTCNSCRDDLENYCPKANSTYTLFEGQPKNYGGFSDIFVVQEHFAVRFPDTLPLEGGAPLLCAGITVYSPMKYFGLSEAGMHLGVVGLGGLGHLAVKFAKAFGMKTLYCLLCVMQAATSTMDGIIDTVSAPHPLNPLVDLLNCNGKLILLGAPDLKKPAELSIFPLLVGRKLIAGSAAGGLKETQEMLDFAGKHNITADVEVIQMDYVNTAMKRLAKGDIRYRFVIDIGNTLRA